MLRLKRDFLFRPVDNSSVVFFRMAFGAIMLWEVTRYFSNDWIGRYWIEPEFHFHYFGFEWLNPIPGDAMYVVWGVMGVAAAMVALGLLYRVAAVVWFVGFTYSFLLEEARYLNHFYLICLLSFLLIVIPAHRGYSLDAMRSHRLQGETSPAWHLWLLRFQMAAVYVYGGIAKINTDWLRGEPVRMWIKDLTDLPVVGGFFYTEFAVYLIAYGGMFFDLFIVFFVAWRRTRILAFLVAAVFHLMNTVWFNIGVFPWLALAATTLYFPPGWARALLGRRGRLDAAPDAAFPPWSRPLGVLVIVFVLFQTLMPLRHHLYPGSVNWTEEGHRFSWRMKLRSKRGSVEYDVYNPDSGEVEVVEPADLLPRWQRKSIAGRPDMVLEFAHYVASQYPNRVTVNARSRVSLNGRKKQHIINPAVDLSRVERRLWPPADWIEPLTQPFRNTDEE